MNQEIQALEQALSHHQSGDLKNASILYQAVLKTNPIQADALYLYALVQHQQGYSQEAISLFTKALQYTTDKANVLYNLANVHYELNQLDQAIRTYSEVLKIQENHISSLNNLGSIFTKRDPKKAIIYLSKSYSLNPNEFKSLQNLAISLNLVGEQLQAFEILRQHYNQYQSELAYYNTVTSVLVNLRYDLLNPQQKDFLLDLFKCSFVCYDKLSHIVGVHFIHIVNQIISSSDLKPVDELTLSYLSLGCIATLDEETAFNRLRLHLAQNHKTYLLEQKDQYIILLDSIAYQSFKLEFSNDLDHLLNDEFKNLNLACPYLVLLKACFHKLDFNEYERLEPLNLTYTRSAYRLEANILASHIDSTPLTHKISLEVSNQYEENPYPKWCYIQRFVPKPLRQYLLERVSKTNKIPALYNDTRVLIAGCGTGKVLCEVLTQIHYNKAYGIDLSLTSLQYSKHNISNFNLKHIQLKKLDILDCDSLQETFNFIDCSGVLHHMQDPQAGLKALYNVLTDDGFMSLALYSKAARRNINLVRHEVKDLDPTPQNIRNVRKKILELEKSDPRSSILNSSDFYSVSGCRDLLFHVCEHQYDLLEIKNLLDDNNLEFCGFEFSNQNSLMQYLHRFPEDPQAINLSLWHQFELENPDFFLAMYQFLVCKKTTSY